jgi:transcriptional regulator with XRE-family HTH domain
MTALQLQQALTRLGMTQAALARLTDTNRRTVTRWSSGASDVPAVVAMLLYLMLDTGATPDQLRTNPNQLRRRQESNER